MRRKKIPFLNKKTLEQGLQFLSESDPDLAVVLERSGHPPLWARKPGFPTLVHIILEQQVSLGSARAAFKRLLELASPLTPERFLELDDARLKAAGFSRQKTGYSRQLALSLIEGRLDLRVLNRMDDEQVKVELMKIKGVGNWTADIYLLMVLRRPDVWPKGDLALAVAMQQVKRLGSRPGPDELEELSIAWKPWRAVAARILWHHYLSKPRRAF